LEGSDQTKHATLPALQQMKDTGHYYDIKGKAVFEVPNKSKGGMRPTTLRDAKVFDNPKQIRF